jgi:glycosyltransferase involved in cell wall biosynthesis
VLFGIAAGARAMGREVSVLGVAHRTAAPIAELCGTDAVYAPLGPRSLGWSPGLGRRLALERWDVVHLHGLFTWPSVAVRGWGRRTGGPVVIAPHGMLEPWALSRSSWKKRLFSAIVEDANLRSTACLHALCADEAANIRRLGWKRPIAVIPNGVCLEDAKLHLNDPDFDERFGIEAGKRVLLFLSRIHPKKGLSPLLHAWKAVERQSSGWDLVIAGPDQLGHERDMRALVVKLGIERNVRFIGPIYGGEKRAALAAAAAFVLPSYSEGFSMAVLEALSWRVPAVVTRACNFDVSAFGGGWVTEPEAGPLSETLRDVLLSTPERLSAMGERGRAQVELKYTWPTVAAQLWNVYEWVRGAGDRPGCIE